MDWAGLAGASGAGRLALAGVLLEAFAEGRAGASLLGAVFPPDLAAGFKGLVGAAFLVCFVAGWLEGRAAALGAGLGCLVLGLADGVGLVR
ncbi:hypothetical protein [Meiothermus granaticius]|uniref:hypothetical protein n=1 Tax=Meiothermus granaticius TaxID=863370 RepID=UPI000E65CDED|nr:hypothetical protein [Meiothermus granaticius]